MLILVFIVIIEQVVVAIGQVEVVVVIKFVFIELKIVVFEVFFTLVIHHLFFWLFARHCHLISPSDRGEYRHRRSERRPLCEIFS